MKHLLRPRIWPTLRVSSALGLSTYCREYAFEHSGLRVPGSSAISAVSLRCFTNNPG